MLNTVYIASPSPRLTLAPGIPYRYRYPATIRSIVHWVLRRPNLFLNTTSDATLLPRILEAAGEPEAAPSDQEIAAQIASHQMEALFVRDVLEGV